MIQEQSEEGVLCRTPLGYKEGHEWAALMTLKNFASGGSDVADGLILVCVKSIGARKKCRFPSAAAPSLLSNSQNLNIANSINTSYHQER